jgi:hypothetical protein
MTLDEVDTTLYHICLIVINLLRPPNTDNMGKLFVMLFAFVPAPKTDS